jgi:thymidylate synthase
MNITQYHNVLAIQSMLLKLNLYPQIVENNHYYTIKIKKFLQKKNGFFSEGYYWSHIQSITKDEKKINEVYNLSVSEDETYTVNCCSVHNCYGFQWRNFNGEYDSKKPLKLLGGVDQVSKVIESIKTDPFSRRHIITNWNPCQLDKMSLPPCHILMQFYITEDSYRNKYLSCQFYQRSQDLFLGAPFNILSYAILTHLIALKTGTIAKELVMTVGDQHIYSNHLNQIKKQMGKKEYAEAHISLNQDLKNKKLEDINVSDFNLIGYYHNAILKGKMAV